MADTIEILPSPEMDMLRLSKESGYNYRLRRQEDWRENYTLYRDKVIVNRLTQRQSVNIPIMKKTIRTLLKDVDDMPVIYFENLDNDKQAELFQNEYWKWTLEGNDAEVKDIVDKRQVFLFGRSFDQWQIVNGKIEWTIQDPEDMLVDRYVDPVNIDTARFVIHTHIYLPLSSLENNSAYNQAEVKELKTWFAGQQGLIKAADNQKMTVEKNRKMADMGLQDVDSPVLGETYVELTLYFMKREAESTKDENGKVTKTYPEQIWMYVTAEDMKILQKAPLEEIIGTTSDNFWRDHFPYETWADDVERQDFWSDGIADIVRTPNKVLNTWFSQLIENRTLKNFNMQVYDATIEGFSPGSFSPIPWGWYPVQGKPSDVYQQMQVSDLSDSLEELTYVESVVEKASGATATLQGAQTDRQITLGEVQLSLGQAKERIKGMSKFYTPTWKRRAQKFLKLIEAAPEQLDAVKIYKKGRNSNDIYGRTIQPNDWMTKSGYQTQVWAQDDKHTQDSQQLQVLNAVVQNIPGNPKLIGIYQRKLLEFADLKPDEINEVMLAEAERAKAIAAAQANPMNPGNVVTAGGPGPAAAPQQPQQPQLPAGA